MARKLISISLLVDEYDRAIDYYTQTLGFKLIEDTPINESKRWVLISPSENNETSLLLAKAANDEQKNQIGNQSGGRVFLFLQSDDFWNDYHEMKSKGVEFLEEPRSEKYGMVVVFQDLYGNKWDLIGEKINE